MKLLPLCYKLCTQQMFTGGEFLPWDSVWYNHNKGRRAYTKKKGGFISYETVDLSGQCGDNQNASGSSGGNAPVFYGVLRQPVFRLWISAEPKRAIAQARETIAKALGAKSNEIYFTYGGTESDNWALISTAEAYQAKGKHIITTKIEHHAILHTCEYLEQRGFEVTYLDVDEFGVVKLDELEKAIRPDTILISVMFANNEIGTIEPIKEIGEIAKKHGILFHTDAVQAFCHVPINVDECHIDMLSSSAHKLNGPKEPASFISVPD